MVRHVVPWFLLVSSCLACSHTTTVRRCNPTADREVAQIPRLPPTPPPSSVPAAPQPPPTPPALAQLPVAEPESPEPEVATRPATEWMSWINPPAERIAQARVLRTSTVKALFEEAQVKFPPARVFLRAFKQEATMELWAASSGDEPFRRITTYGICALSGKPGPKRRRGDFMVPEGFYSLVDYSPASSYHLAMLVSYPNDSDRILGARDPGDQIMVHGRCASVGCLAMSDERIQEIWVATSHAFYNGGPVPIHIFPARDLRRLIDSGAYPTHTAFWENLREGYEIFEQTHRLPIIRIDGSGQYHFHEVKRTSAGRPDRQGLILRRNHEQ